MPKWLLVVIGVAGMLVLIALLVMTRIRQKEAGVSIVGTPSGKIAALEGASAEDAKRVGMALAKGGARDQLVVVGRPSGRLQVTFGMAADVGKPLAEEHCAAMGAKLRPELGEPLTVRAMDPDLHVIHELRLDRAEAPGSAAVYDAAAL